MKKTINILGAFDRYNYGDLLFPIIIEEYLKKYKENFREKYQLEYYGLIDSDLSSVGGKKTKSIKRLYKDNISSGSAVIVSGGEVIGAKNTNLYLHLCRNYPEFFLKSYTIKIARRLLGEKIINSFSRKYFGIISDYPWIIQKDHFINDIHIIYNTVGGRIPKSNFDHLQNQLSDASYISVRENDVLSNLNIQKAHLFPDSATVMSEFFPLNELKNLINPRVRKFVVENPNYICIQTNLSIFKKNKKEFLEQINKIKSNSKDIKILLLPLGYATNHDDRIALRMIKEKIPHLVELLDDISIYDMMYAIGNCIFFAGTSLHGNITAMSYSIPHIGLSKDRPKLESYLSTWDIEEQNHCIEISEIYDYYIKLSQINKGVLEVKRNELVNSVLDNFQKLFSTIEI